MTFDWDGLRWKGGPPFYVWRRRWGEWHVRCGHAHGSFWVASFARRSEAEAAAGRLNEIARKMGWRDFVPPDTPEIKT